MKCKDGFSGALAGTFLLLVSSSVMAQGRDIGAGRAGGALSIHSESRDASIAARNDSELAKYASFIASDLKSDIRSARREYNSAQDRIPSLSVEQFLAVKQSAVSLNLNTQKLVAALLVKRQGKAPSTQGAVGFTSDTERRTFEDKLASAISTVKPSVSRADALRVASAAVSKVLAAS